MAKNDQDKSESIWDGKVPDAVLCCDRCKSEWIIHIPTDPEDSYHKAAEMFGMQLCPECIEAIYPNEEEQEEDCEG